MTIRIFLRFSLVISLLLAFNFSVFAQKPEDISKEEQEELRSMAVQRIQNLADWLNFITQKGTSSEDVQDCIGQMFQEHLFFDSLVTLEDDIYAIRADTMFPKDVGLSKYLNDWHFFYNKSMDGKSITYSDLRLSGFSRKEYLFLKVYFLARYRERHKDFDEDYPPRKRVATLRLEQVEGKWQVSIAGISFYRGLMADGSLISESAFEEEFRPFVKEKKNRMPLNSNGVADSSQVEVQFKLQKEYDSLYAEAVKGKLLLSENQKKKENQYLAAIEKADSLLLAKMFPEAIEVYTEARTLKPFEIYPRNKIRELGQLLVSTNKQPQDIFNEKVAEGDLKKKLRDYESAIQSYQIALHLFPDHAGLKEKMHTCENILRRRAEIRSMYMSGNKKLALKAFSNEANSNKENPDFYFERAKCYLHTGDRKKGISDLNKAISLDPGFKGALLVRAAFWEKEKNLPLAIADYTVLISVDPNFPEFHFLKGQALAASKDYETALLEYDKAIKADANQAAYLCGKADVLRIQKNYSEAIGLTEKAISLKPSFANSHFIKGLVLLEQGEEKPAAQAILKARRLGLAQGFLKNLDELAEACEKQAEQLEKQDAAENAFAMLRKSIALRPAWPGVYMQLAGLHVRQKRMNDAIKAVDQAIFVKEDFLPAYIKKGELLLSTKEFEAALNPFYSARRLDRKNLDACVGIGEAFTNMQKYDSAMFWFGEAIKLKSDFARAYLQRGICHFRKESYVRASQDLEDAIRYESGLAEAYFYKGKVNKAYNRFDKAIDDFSSAIQYGYSKFECNIEVGNSYEKIGKPEKALRFFTAAINENRDRPEAYLFRGMSNLRSDNKKDAMADLDEGLKIDTSLALAPYRIELGFLCLEFDEFVKAESNFIKALIFDRYSPRANFGLGICEFQRGEIGVSMKSFEQALLVKKLEFAQIKKMPGIKKILKHEKFKELREIYLK